MIVEVPIGFHRPPVATIGGRGFVLNLTVPRDTPVQVIRVQQGSRYEHAAFHVYETWAFHAEVSPGRHEDVLTRVHSFRLTFQPDEPCNYTVFDFHVTAGPHRGQIRLYRSTSLPGWAYRFLFLKFDMILVMPGDFSPFLTEENEPVPEEPTGTSRYERLGHDE